MWGHRFAYRWHWPPPGKEPSRAPRICPPMHPPLLESQPKTCFRLRQMFACGDIQILFPWLEPYLGIPVPIIFRSLRYIAPDNTTVEQGRSDQMKMRSSRSHYWEWDSCLMSWLGWSVQPNKEMSQFISSSTNHHGSNFPQCFYFVRP